MPLKRLRLIWGLLLSLPLALGETALALCIQPTPLRAFFQGLFSSPLLAFLNFLPFWLLTLAFTFLFQNPFYAAALTGGLGGVLSLVNRTMIEKRDEPLSPKDFALLKEAGDAMKSYGMDLHLPSVLGILGFVLVMVVLGLLIGGKRPFQRRWRNVCLSLVGGAACLGTLAGCVLGPYSSKELYRSFPVENSTYIAGTYNQLGFPYCFCFHFSTYPVEKPEGYSNAQALRYIEEYPEKAGDPKAVNVIMVMDEAFSDVTNYDAFRYPAGEEPLRFFNSLADEKNAIVGRLVVPNFGAGTANTEFDVLTGMQTNLIANGGTSAFRVLHGDVDSVLRVFAEDGYQTEFIHPGQAWFYNRQNVYRYFGAEKLLFSESFKDAERKASWVTDAAVGRRIQKEFEEAVSAGEPWFNYTVTIQNHMAYTPAKYDDYPIAPAPLSEGISEEAASMLSIYAEGARDADALLQSLTEYFSGREEPVLLVFFGDHLPNLGDNYLSYREMGVEIGEGDDPAATLRTYETPYVVWVNEPAAALLDFENAKEALGLPEGNYLNANYLGAMTLELTGRRDADSFFSFLNETRRKLPVLHNQVGITGDGEVFSSLPEEYTEELKKLRYWEYYKLTNH